jgi:hypothetical protein
VFFLCAVSLFFIPFSSASDLFFFSLTTLRYTEKRKKKMGRWEVVGVIFFIVVTLASVIASMVFFFVPIAAVERSCETLDLYPDQNNCAMRECLVMIDGDYTRYLREKCPVFPNGKCWVNGLWKSDDDNVPSILQTSCGGTTSNITTATATISSVATTSTTTRRKKKSSSSSSSDSCKCERNRSYLIERSDSFSEKQSKGTVGSGVLFAVSSDVDFVIVGDCSSCTSQGSDECISNANPRESNGFIASSVFFAVGLVVLIVSIGFCVMVCIRR